MRKMPAFLLIIAIAMIIPMIGCDDDDDLTFVEYTNPMANNPVNTLPWLMKAKQVAKDWFVVDPNSGATPINEQNGWRDVVWGAYIKLYTYQGQEYYEVRYGGLELKSGLKYSFLNFQSYVFDLQGKLCIAIIGGDGVAIQPGYEHLSEFWGVATFKTLLWEYKVNN